MSPTDFEFDGLLSCMTMMKWKSIVILWIWTIMERCCITRMQDRNRKGATQPSTSVFLREVRQDPYLHELENRTWTNARSPSVVHLHFRRGDRLFVFLFWSFTCTSCRIDRYNNKCSYSFWNWWILQKKCDRNF